MIVNVDSNGNLVFNQYALDLDGDVIDLVRLYLKAVDGVLLDPADQEPGWLVNNHTTSWTEDIGDGRSRLDIDFAIPARFLDVGAVYTIEVQVQDAVSELVIGEFTLSPQVA